MVIKINYTSSDIYVSTNVSPVYVVVNYSSVNNGGGVAWGGITGTLSTQTDLQTALNLKVPYTGATGAVNLGAFSLTANSLIKSGGTSSQFLKADGSVDSSAYITGITSGNVTTALGFTPVPTTRTITINGTTLDLSADRTYTVGATPAGANTQIQYNNSGVFGASAGLVYADASGVMTLRKDQNALTGLSIINGTSGTSAQSRLLLQCSGATDFLAIAKTSPTSSPFSYFTAGDSYLYSYEANLNIATDSSTKQIRFGNVKNISTAQMTLTAAGRLLLGTTTESTFLLDVNGTARVSGKLTTTTGDAQFGNIGASTGEFRIDGVNGAGYAFAVYSSSTLRFGVTGFGGVTTNNNSLNCGTSSIIARTATIGGFGGENTTLDLYAQAGVNPATFKISNGTTALKIFSTGNSVLGGGTDNASALLNLESTTKGFLPPRMTNAQILAIATPVNGLMAYNTTIDHMCVYQAGAWAKLSHSPM